MAKRKQKTTDVGEISLPTRQLDQTSVKAELQKSIAKIDESIHDLEEAKVVTQKTMQLEFSI